MDQVGRIDAGAQAHGSGLNGKGRLRAPGQGGEGRSHCIIEGPLKALMHAVRLIPQQAFHIAIQCDCRSHNASMTAYWHAVKMLYTSVRQGHSGLSLIGLWAAPCYWDISPRCSPAAGRRERRR